MITLIVKYKFQRMHYMSGYESVQKSSIVHFESDKHISEDAIIDQLRSLEKKNNKYSGAGHEILDIKQIKPLEV